MALIVTLSKQFHRSFVLLVKDEKEKFDTCNSQYFDSKVHTSKKEKRKKNRKSSRRTIYLPLYVS
jgi:hypothetical protein